MQPAKIAYTVTHASQYRRGENQKTEVIMNTGNTKRNIRLPMKGRHARTVAIEAWRGQYHLTNDQILSVIAKAEKSKDTSWQLDEAKTALKAIIYLREKGIK